MLTSTVPSSVSTLAAKLNETWTETVLADLELALTFAHIAVTSLNRETRGRNRANAIRAFLAIRDRLLPLCEPDAEQQREISQDLQELEAYLRGFGVKFKS